MNKYLFSLLITLISSLSFSQDFNSWGNREICFGDTAILGLQLENDTLFYQSSIESTVTDTVFIPDDADGFSGNGITTPAQISVNSSGFVNGDTLKSLADFNSICLDIEHSYIGDLDINLVCPNGSSVMLINFNPPNSAGLDFGLPEIGVGYGTPYEYCWSPNGSNEIIDENTTGTTMIDNSIVYDAIGNWNSLIGCPLNGPWSIQIFDDFSGDDGYVFGASIDLSTNILDSVVNVFDTLIHWNANPLILNSSSNEIEVSPTIAGTHYFDYFIIDIANDTLFFQDSLIVYQGITNDSIFNLCEGNSYELPSGLFVTTTGLYGDTLQSLLGCDSIINSYVEFLPAATNIFIDTTLCADDEYYFLDGSHTDTSGVFQDTISNHLGCDSIIFNINVNIVEIEFMTYFQDICEGDSLIVNDIVYDTEGLFVDVVVGQNGCDSFSYIINLTFLEQLFYQNVTICYGQDYLLPNGAIVNTAGLYIDSLESTFGCDSILHTSLTILSPYLKTQYRTICDGENFILPTGELVTESGLYTDTIRPIGGCDTIYNITLNVLSLLSSDLETFELCENESIFINGVSYDSTGIFQEIIPVFGQQCDSVYNFQIIAVDTILTGIVNSSLGLPLQNSLIYLINLNSLDSMLSIVETTTTNSQGEFMFNTVLPNSYLKAIPDLQLFPDELSTYFSTSPVIQDAEEINVFCDTLIANFSTIQGTNTGGIGFISGQIGNGAGKNSEIGAPVANLNLVLVNDDNQVVQYTKTDLQGEFVFNDLYSSRYSLWVDKPFVENSLAPNLLLASNQNLENLQFILHSDYLEQIQNVGVDLLDENGFEIYPNPTNSILYITNNEQKYFDVEIVNTIGEVVFTSKSKDSVIAIDLENLNIPLGVYFVKLKNKNKISSSKFIYN